ncbi:hypothetical protein D3C72_377480 [compost metagenome]|jgi:hypothetical protein
MANQLDYEVEEYRREWVSRKIALLLGDDHNARHSELGRLLDGVTRAAAIDAIRAGHRHDDPTERWGRNQFDGMLTDASIPIDHLRWAMTPPENDKSGRVWGHRDFLLSDVRAKPDMRARMVPQFQRHEIEQIAGSYVEGTVKSAEADRLFVDVLVAMEFYQFADSVLNAPSVPIIAPSMIKRKPILDWIAGRFVSALCGFIGYGLFWLASKVGFPESWLWIVGLILVGLFALESAWSLIILPRQWFAVHAAQKKLTGMLDQMNGVYAALASTGPVSAAHVTELVKKSTDTGIVWPGPLHVLLEDIMARGGRF